MIVAVILVVSAGVAGWWAWSTRPQGEPQAVEFADASFSDDLTGATVLALGEATHGNAEFQRLRLQLVRKLPGFRAIVLEDDYGSVAQANAYVQGGSGTPRDAALRLGFVLNHTQETAELLRWLRGHNAGLPPGERIELIGMDVQRVDANKELSLAALASQDPRLAGSLREELAGWTDETDSGDGAGTLRTAARPVVERLIAALGQAADEEAADEETADGDVTEPGSAVARDAALALRQHLDLQAAPDSRYAELRATIMAANLERTVAEQAVRGNGHTLLFAHNGHVDKESRAFAHHDLGELAFQRWGDRYRAIGTEYRHNTLRTGNRDHRWTVSIDNPTPLRGMFAGTRIGWLEFSVASDVNRALLERTVPMGSAGEGFQQWQAWVPWLSSVSMVPARSYDALVFVGEATPVTPLG